MSDKTPASDEASEQPSTKLELPSNVAPVTPFGVKVRNPHMRAKLVAFGHDRETDPTKTFLDQNLGYSARLFAQVAVPMRNPGEIPYYERRNGNIVLTMQPALLTQSDGSRISRYPYGVYPRLALTYVATEAVRTQSPVIDLGSSMRSFLSKLDVEYSGRNANIVKSQLAALFGARLQVSGLASNEAGHGVAEHYFQIANSVALWFAGNNRDDQEGLWSSEVTLSQEFFKSIIDAPVPVDLKTLRALGGSSLRIDIYLWATHRVYYLERVTRIKWEDLNNQFGAQYGRLRAFKAAFKSALEEVQLVYPQLRAEAKDDYLMLYPSLTHVRSNKRLKAVEGKPAAS